MRPSVFFRLLIPVVIAGLLTGCQKTSLPTEKPVSQARVLEDSYGRMVYTDWFKEIVVDVGRSDARHMVSGCILNHLKGGWKRQEKTNDIEKTSRFINMMVMARVCRGLLSCPGYLEYVPIPSSLEGKNCQNWARDQARELGQ